MSWKKLGRIFEPRIIDNYLISHASNPLPIHLEGSIFRILFSGRDKKNRSSVGYIDFDMKRMEVMAVCKKNLIHFGGRNSFFSDGISIGDIYTIQNNSFILFMGWNYHNSQHWRGDIGRIRLSKDFKMELDPDKIFLGIDSEDQISLSYPFVLKNGNEYLMWYGSTISWKIEDNKEMVHVIKTARSRDGEKWERLGIAVPFELGFAQAFSRPSVLKDKYGYHMWYSYRSGDGTPYRIGYAKSEDGINWSRKHKLVGIDVSPKGWDSEMICYPYVFEFKEKRYMLYNGNGYGKSGFGLAVYEG